MNARLIYRTSQRSTVAHAIVRVTVGRGEPTVWRDELRIACGGVEVDHARLLELAETGRATCLNCARIYAERATEAHLAELKAQA